MLTNWLIRAFVRDHEDTHDPEVRRRYGRMAGWVGIATNAALAAGKFLAGLWSGSVSIMGDAANNLSDAAASVVSLLGFKMAGKPADEEHPYGHARYEHLAGLTVALLIMVIGFELGRSGIEKLVNPSPVQFSWLTIGILGASVLLKLWMMRFNHQVGARIDSNTLIATAADSRNDVVTTLAVMVAALISRFVGIELDGWMALGVAAFILYSGYGLIKDTLDPLLGQAPDPELVKGIRDTILSYPGVLGTHDLLVHDYGPGRRFASVHVEMAAEGDVMLSHEVIDDIERDFLRKDGLHMIVHLDPIITEDPEVQDLRLWLSERVTDIHPELTIHDLRIVKGKTKSNVIFDAVRPMSLAMDDTELKRALCRMVQKERPNYRCVITIDDDYAALPKEPEGTKPAKKGSPSGKKA